MNELLIITHVDFWRQGAGHRTRITSLIRFLVNHVRITVAYLGIELKLDHELIEAGFPQLDFVFLEKDRTLSLREYCERLCVSLDVEKFNFVLIEYIELTPFLNYLSERTISFLDTHDLVHAKTISFKEGNIPYSGILLTREEELEAFSCFDYVIMIQSEEYFLVAEEIGYKKTLLIPHAVQYKKTRMQESVNSIGFLGSEYPPNIEAIEWFLQNVWINNNEMKEGLSLNIYGRVCSRINPRILAKNNGVILNGYVDNPEDVYEANDIIINPVFHGAGLKIKNIEAMGHGLPLISTSHGASGIESGMNEAFILSNTATEFISSLNRLISDIQWRTCICNNAFKYVNHHFNPEKCYSPLINIFRLDSDF